MKKTRSLIGKTLLIASVLLLLSAPFITSASAILIDQIPEPTIYMDPFRIEGTAGSVVIAFLRIQNVEVSAPLFSYQVGLVFDPNTVGCGAVVLGPFLTSAGGGAPLAFPGTVDNATGIITPYGWSLTDITKAPSGSGILVEFHFQMKVDGYSDIHITDFIPVTNDGVTEIPVKTVDYFTAVLDSSQFVVKIVGNPEGSGAQFSAHNAAKINIVEGAFTYLGQIGFSITSPDTFNSGFGFFNVTIPKAMMSCTAPSAWWVLLDGSTQGARTVNENSTHSTINLEFTYGSAPMSVAIRSTEVVPEFSMVFFAFLLVLATFAAALFGKATWSYKRKV